MIRKSCASSMPPCARGNTQKRSGKRKRAKHFKTLEQNGRRLWKRSSKPRALPVLRLEDARAKRDVYWVAGGCWASCINFWNAASCSGMEQVGKSPTLPKV